MTLLLDVVVIGGGILVGRWISRAVRARRAVAPVARDAPSGDEPSRSPFEGLPCKLGDVVVRNAERDEAWLAGALVFEEGGPPGGARTVAVLFVAPEAGADRGLYVHAEAPAELAWLSPVPRGAILIASEPPHALEHEGARFERVRRLPARVRRLGTGAPEVGAEAVIAEYAGGERRLVVVAGNQQTLAWAGESVALAGIEVLPGGGDDAA